MRRLQPKALRAENEHGFGYPAHVKREFERFLTCGILAAGFARIQCGKKGCTFERLVAYSCKGRCIYPSCVSTNTPIISSAGDPPQAELDFCDDEPVFDDVA